MTNGNRDWNTFALLLIDMQNDFWPREFSEQFSRLPENTAQLLQFCRAEGITVIHLRASFQPDMSDWMVRYQLRQRIPCVAGTAGAEGLPFAQALPGEKVIYKHSFDGFLAPELLPYLRQAQKRFLLVGGLITSTCVLFTAVSAMQNGFLTAVIEDCCADAPFQHENTLDTYTFIFYRTKLAQLPSDYETWQADLSALAAVQERF
jgi:nicotinamidase-related amidase